jgi:hypothetical protein
LPGENLIQPRYTDTIVKKPFALKRLEPLPHMLSDRFGFDHDRIGQMEKRWREKRQA